MPVPAQLTMSVGILHMEVEVLPTTGTAGNLVAAVGDRTGDLMGLIHS